MIAPPQPRPVPPGAVKFDSPGAGKDENKTRDALAGRMFTGPQCGLGQRPDWTVKRHRMD